MQSSASVCGCGCPMSLVLRPVWIRVCYQLVGCWAVSAVNAFSRRSRTPDAPNAIQPSCGTLELKLAPRPALKLMQYSYYLVCLVYFILLYFILFNLVLIPILLLLWCCATVVLLALFIGSTCSCCNNLSWRSVPFGQHVCLGFAPLTVRQQFVCLFVRFTLPLLLFYLM